MIGITVAAKKSFRMYHFWWILAEEILVLIWHLSSLILMIDYFGKGKIKQGGVDFLSHMAFWPFVATVSLEFIFMIQPLFYNTEYYSHFRCSMPKAKVFEVEVEEEVPVELEQDKEDVKINKSADETVNNMIKYNTQAQKDLAPVVPQ